jgi:hypothetical protein
MKAEDLVQKVSMVGNLTAKAPGSRVISFNDLVMLPTPDRILLPKKDPSLILKFYVAQELGKYTPSGGDVREAMGYLQNKYNMESALSGMGFAVLSDLPDGFILNVCKWHDEFSDVIFPSIHLFDRQNFEWTQGRVEEAGAFCSGEKAVYDHENAAWMRYLKSRRADEDKVKYLADTLPSGTMVD